MFPSIGSTPDDLIIAALNLMDLTGMKILMGALIIIAVVGAIYDRWFNKG